MNNKNKIILKTFKIYIEVLVISLMIKMNYQNTKITGVNLQVNNYQLKAVKIYTKMEHSQYVNQFTMDMN